MVCDLCMDLFDSLLKGVIIVAFVPGFLSGIGACPIKSDSERRVVAERRTCRIIENWSSNNDITEDLRYSGHDL